MLWFSPLGAKTEKAPNHPGANEAESTKGLRGAHTKPRGRWGSWWYDMTAKLS